MSRFLLTGAMLVLTMTSSSVSQECSQSPLTFQPVNHIQITPVQCGCNDSSPNNDRLLNVTETILRLVETPKEPQSCSCTYPTPSPLANPKPKDCAEILAAGGSTNDVYAIYPDGAGGPFFVFCDMDTDGGGWTVFQRREDGSIDFYLDWSDYKNGFGSVASEHWLGNDKIHRLSVQKTYQLRVDLEDFDGNTTYALYDRFRMENEAANYTLHLGAYSGEAGSSLSGHSGHPFSTRDRDNDMTSSNCAVIYRGAWWYTGCHSSNLNGLYLGGVTPTYAQGVVWSQWQGYYYSLKKTEMKIRPM